ncbi:MAG: alpha/beta hydrolase [Clostridiales bacterium]|nr:alpha/beta hydrolase [Clostridiales bacterium]
MVETANGKVHVFSKIQYSTKPTYVFLDGFGSGSAYYNYKALWEPMSESASVVTLDYLGYGMSEETKSDRTIQNIVSEIDDALSNAGIQAPYTFVSHSLGGFYATGYGIKYPEKVQALILLDNAIPSEAESDTELLEYKQAKPVFMALKYTGLLRLMTQAQAPGLDPDEQKESVYYERKMMLNKTIINEIDNTIDNAKYLADKSVPDSIPQLILVSKANDDASKTTGAVKSWLEYHQDCLNANPNSKLRLMDSGHYIHYEQPDEVVQAIDNFINSKDYADITKNGNMLIKATRLTGNVVNLRKS